MKAKKEIIDRRQLAVDLNQNVGKYGEGRWVVGRNGAIGDEDSWTAEAST